eukprot:Seg893.3 transcript_id=Seg893.3/GoldUCD/mRNA.D3Y31 product="Copia protein" protein_id=Seg893.3/GoldUCD/D3Y31
MDAKSPKCIFIGYSLYRKGYRLYDPKTKRLYESRDVLFVENEFGDRTQVQKADAKKVDATVVSQVVITSEEEEEREADHGENANDSENDPDSDEENNQNIEDLQQPRRSNRVRRAPERDGAITGDWWQFEDSLNADTYENPEEPTTIQQALNSSAKEVQLSGFIDADWGGDVNGRKSQSGYMFTICGGVVSWASKKQTSVALSSTEAEYVAACLATQEAVWLRSLLADLNFVQEEPTVVQEDNQGAIAMSKNPKYHVRTKHIDIKHHFIRDKVENGELLLKYCPTNDMIADMLTKALSKTLFEKFRMMMNVTNRV